MTTEEAKKIRIADYLHSLGYSPVKQQGVNLWYKSPFREENEPSFKVNTEREQWFDFGLGKGGNIIALAAHLYATESVPYILKRIEEQTPHVRPLFTGSLPPSRVSSNLTSYSCLLLPCSLTCRKGE